MFRIFRSAIFAVIATATLAGCVTGYSYRAGEGDYYYAEPSIEYVGTGDPGGWYGGFGDRYGYGYGYGYGPVVRYDRFGRPYFGAGNPYWRYGYGGFYGYPPSYHYGYRPPHHRPPSHRPNPPGVPHQPPPPGPPGGGLDPPGPPGGGDQPPPPPRRDPDFGDRDLEHGGGSWPRREARVRVHSSQPALPPSSFGSPPGPSSQPQSQSFPRRDDAPPRDLYRPRQAPPEAMAPRPHRGEMERPMPRPQPAYEAPPRRDMAAPAPARQVDLPEREHGREPR